MSDTCWVHHRHERIPWRGWACYECGHAWSNLRLVWATFYKWRSLRRPSHIYSCPLCIHDW